MRRMREVQSAQVNALARKRICKRDRVKLAKPGETTRPWRDEQSRSADVSHAG